MDFRLAIVQRRCKLKGLAAPVQRRPGLSLHHVQLGEVAIRHRQFASGRERFQRNDGTQGFVHGDGGLTADPVQARQPAHRIACLQRIPDPAPQFQ
jgi:hypothetical protein